MGDSGSNIGIAVLQGELQGKKSVSRTSTTLQVSVCFA